MLIVHDRQIQYLAATGAEQVDTRVRPHGSGQLQCYPGRGWQDVPSKPYRYISPPSLSRPPLTPRADTAGQEEYRGLWASSALQSDAYLLVYDITSPASLATLNYFNDLVEMEGEERMSHPGAVPHVKIVAGNKCDLAEARAVSSQEGLEWARENGCGFMETSARNVVNIEETFERKLRGGGMGWIGG